jgi:hypothetical protein
MCTVSYLPLQHDQYLLTSNRDESALRPIALPIAEYTVNGRTLYFPKDPKGGGSWIATTGNEATVCLMNGGFEPHPFDPTHVYRMSRGLVLLDYFSYENAEAYAAQYDFDNIEPFTLIVLENRNDSPTHLTELRWDGKRITLTPMDAAVPHIWSSAQLYTPRVRTMREQWFGRWLEAHERYTQEHILDFHRFAGTGDDTSDLILDLGELKTISICSIHRDETVTTAVYTDLLKGTTNHSVIYHE